MLISDENLQINTIHSITLAYSEYYKNQLVGCFAYVHMLQHCCRRTRTSTVKRGNEDKEKTLEVRTLQAGRQSCMCGVDCLALIGETQSYDVRSYLSLRMSQATRL